MFYYFKLEERSWIIVNDKGVQSIVTGPGVIGLYPVLQPLPDTVRSHALTNLDKFMAVFKQHEESAPREASVLNGLPLPRSAPESSPTPFEYASQTQLDSPSGHMRGYFTFSRQQGYHFFEVFSVCHLVQNIPHLLRPSFKVEVAPWVLAIPAFIF